MRPKRWDRTLTCTFNNLATNSGKELPVLAILTNGRHFRIYSPQWRHRRTFAEKVIYEFELKDLSDIQLLNRLEKILGFSNYESEEFFDHIEQREREIIQVKKEIEDIKTVKSEQVTELQSEINELKEKVLLIKDQIKSKEQIVSDINADKIPEIATKKAETYFPLNIIPRNLNSPTTAIIHTSIDESQDKDAIETSNNALNALSSINRDKSTLSLYFEETPFALNFKKSDIGFFTVKLLHEKGLIDENVFDFLRKDRSCTWQLIRKRQEVITKWEIRKYRVNREPELIFEGEKYWVARNWGKVNGIDNTILFIEKIIIRFPKIKYKRNN